MQIIYAKIFRPYKKQPCSVFAWCPYFHFMFAIKSLLITLGHTGIFGRCCVTVMAMISAE